jgi:hypothetical protein
VSLLERGLLAKPEKITKAEQYTTTELTLGRAGKGDRVPPS